MTKFSTSYTKNGASKTLVVDRPEHTPSGDPCSKCSLPAKSHRVRRQRKRERKTRKNASLIAKLKEQIIVAIDGEGEDLPCEFCGSIERTVTCPSRPDGESCVRKHIYTYLSAVNENGEKLGSIESKLGLNSSQIFEFLVNLDSACVFGFSLGYDTTMWFESLEIEALHNLLRPETRNYIAKDGKTRRKKVAHGSFRLDYLKRKITIDKVAWKARHRYPKSVARTVIWDVFGFFQASFVKALRNWGVGDDTVLRRIEEMKRSRSSFATMSAAQVQAYCDEECHLLALLVRKLIDAHIEAELPLKSYYGSGSAATAFLERMDVNSFRTEYPDPEIEDWCTRAFFGGRFERWEMGLIEGPIFNYDISSAYPYALVRMPCLACGTWRKYKGKAAEKAARHASMAIVKAEVRDSGPDCWGPLPWRAGRDVPREFSMFGIKQGSILWPRSAPAVWTWRDEFFAAKDTLWPGVRAIEAWVYETSCIHKPFADISQVYLDRLRLGKDAAGLALKLAMNSCYGKCAQSIGSAPFQCWAWAGATTSGCRAQLLRAIACHKDPKNVLMVATDGIISREELSLEKPEDTSTDVEIRGSKKPLGGWESNKIAEGVFIAREGIYWPSGKGVEAKVKSRGISRSVLGGRVCLMKDHDKVYSSPSLCEICGGETFVQADLVEQSFRTHGWTEKVVIKGATRFVGAVSGTRDKKRNPEYGCWRIQPVKVSFRPWPKRAHVIEGTNNLATWVSVPTESSRYDQKVKDQNLEEAATRALEQPDGEYCSI